METTATHSKTETLRKMREGNLKRQEEQKKRSKEENSILEAEIEKAKGEDKKEDGKEKNEKTARRYIPQILIFVFFISLPLSDEVIDWKLVWLILGVNAVLGLFLDPTGINQVFVAMMNWVVIQHTERVYQLPQIIMEAPRERTIGLLVFNVVTILAGNYFYVEQKTLFGKKNKKEKEKKRAEKHSDAKKEDVVDAEQEALNALVLEKQKNNRTDILVAIVTFSNLIILIATGVISAKDLIQALGQLFRAV